VSKPGATSKVATPSTIVLPSYSKKITQTLTSNKPNTHHDGLRFFKMDLDNAYKMDDAKFPKDFSIIFECIETETPVPETIWNEQIYQEFTQRHANNKKEKQANSLWNS